MHRYRQQFSAACQRDDIESVRSLLSSCPSLVNDVLNSDSERGIHIAATHGAVNVFTFLIDSGADIGSRDRHLRTPLLLAAIAGNAEIVQKIVQVSPDHVSDMKANGWTALMYACKGGHTACARILLDAQSPLEMINREGATALHLTSRTEHTECVRLLINHGANILHKTKNGRTCLHAAVASNSLTVAKLLIAAGASIDAADNSKVTPFHDAVQNCSVEFAAYLLAAYVQQRTGGRSLEPSEAKAVQSSLLAMADITGKQPLHYAAIRRDVPLIAYLLYNDANIDAVDIRGCTSLYYSVLKTKGENGVAVNMLSDEPFYSPRWDISKDQTRSSDGQYPSDAQDMAEAHAQGMLQAFAETIDRCFAVSKPSAGGSRRLFYRPTACSCLLFWGANVLLQPPQRSLLAAAAMWGNSVCCFEIIGALLSRCASLDVYPLVVEKSTEFPQFQPGFRILVQYQRMGLLNSACPNEYHTVLDNCDEGSRAVLLEQLLKEDSDGLIPRKLAERGNHYRLAWDLLRVEYLLNAGTVSNDDMEQFKGKYQAAILQGLATG